VKSIKAIIPASKVDMGGILLDQPLPGREIDHIDPFLLIHHWESTLPAGKKQNESGVGPHPHRGFSPVTFIFKGSLHHRDSRGNDSVVHAGGTQWMHAGMGIVHSERPSNDLAEKGGEFEIIQFWVNSPASRKMDKPAYYPLQKEDTPVWTSSDGKTEVGVVAGTFRGAEGPIETLSPLQILRIHLQEGAKLEFDIPEGFNALAYVLDGSLRADGQAVPSRNMIVFEEGEDRGIRMEATETTRVIFLGGQPLGEPVSKYGPFVMNTQTEIMQALRDAQMGKMGVLIEEF
jgi:redox-sensitive bicupin YhaK (pirin superfamily)